MWGMVLFLAAFAFLFFWKTTFVTRIAAGVPLAFVLGMCVWCIADSWEQNQWWSATVFELLRKQWDKLLGCVGHITVSRKTAKNSELQNQV
jgi:hypothetical protein